jgi:hypothetical protein
MTDERLKRNTDRPNRTDTRAEDRPKRVPINGEFDLLNVTGVRPGYHPCWVNENRVLTYKAAGYDFVMTDGVKFGEHHVHQANPHGARYVRNVGNGMLAYLMEIPQEYYDEDREAESRIVDEQEESIRTDAINSGLDHGKLEIDFGRTK